MQVKASDTLKHAREIKSKTRWESVFACNPGTKPNLQELLKFTYTDGRISTLAGEIEAAKCIYKISRTFIVCNFSVSMLYIYGCSFCLC